MNFYNSATGETLTYAQIEALAMGVEPPISASDYINEKGWNQIFGEDEELILFNQDFQEGIANQDANVMPEIPAPNARQYRISMGKNFYRFHQILEQKL